ncbi:MAG: Sec-independent protein translocase protein TatB [Henriciella sp.]
MFDLAWAELGLIALIGVLILGPKELPQAMRAMAKVVRKVRNLAAEFQGHFNEMIREAELEDVRSSMQKLSTSSLKAEAAKVIDSGGEIRAAISEDPFKDQPTTGDAAVADAEKTASENSSPESSPSVEAGNAEPPASEPSNTGSSSGSDPDPQRGQST